MKLAVASIHFPEDEQLLSMLEKHQKRALDLPFELACWTEVNELMNLVAFIFFGY